ncbi:MAG: lipopolysaccharide biosynthesis protein [Prevotellaceae bacterium]|jgi:O-antigen/teichoic acid export membrane protein|nr:lipopolysaccharide biosynthesis protein [Prevotellaceae bacterium]
MQTETSGDNLEQQKPEPTLKEKTAKGLFWGGVGNAAQQIFSLVIGIILLRLLNREDYGMIGMLAIFTAIALSIQDSGFSTALINRQDNRHEDYNAVFWFNVLSSIVMYIILFFSAPLIAKFYDKPELIHLSRILFLGFLFGGIGVVHSAILYKYLMVKERTKIDLVSLIISSITGTALAFLGFAYWGLAVQTVTYIATGTVLRWYYSPWRPTWEFDFKPLKGMFSFSFKLFLTNIFMQIANNIFSVLLGKFYGDKRVGDYSQGNKWMIMGHSFIAGMINSVAHPIMAQVTGDSERLRKVFHKMLRFGAFVSFPLMFGLAFVGREFILITGGEKWLPSVPFLQLFCIWGAIRFIWILYMDVLMSYEKSDIYMWGIILTSTLQLIAIFVMFPWGIFPAIIVYIILSVAGILFWHCFVHKLIKLRLRDVIKDVFPYVSIAILSITVTWAITKGLENIYILFISKITGVALLYTGTLWITNSTILRESVSYLKRKI